MAAAPDPAAIAAAIAALNHVISVVQIYVASTSSVLVWDWLSCLPQEWNYIWKAKWSGMKVLYITVRYYTFAVLIITDCWFFLNWSQESCAKYLRILPGVAVVIDFAIEAVLALRVYALFGGDRRVGGFLILLLTGFLAVMITVPILAFDYIHLPEWPGPCIVTGKASIAGPKYIIAFYASPMLFDTIVTAMTIWKTLERKRAGGLSSLLQVFLRDGLFYFVAITTLNLINVIFFLQPNELIQAVNAPMSIQLSSVLCCRMILNLRSKGDAAASGVKQFSSSRGRWVTDVREGNNNVNLALQPMTGSTNSLGNNNTRSVGQHVSQFGEDPKKSALPLAFSTMDTTGENNAPPGAQGIVVHWETEQEWDKNKEDDEETNSQLTHSRKRRDVADV